MGRTVINASDLSNDSRGCGKYVSAMLSERPTRKSTYWRAWPDNATQAIHGETMSSDSAAYSQSVRTSGARR